MPRTRNIFAIAAAFLLVALLLPFAVNVNRYRSRIAGELEARLGRPVRVGAVRLKLLAWPGFELSNVSIGEDPAFGVEPFIRVSNVRATLRLRSLWTGHMSFSSLVLEQPSVNLVRNQAGRWAVESLGRANNGGSQPGPTVRSPGATLPYVELQDARINFKNGDTKSRLFLSGVDAALYPTGARRLNVRLTGTPARTDRNLTDIGELRVEGSFPAAIPAKSGTADEDVRLNIDLHDAYLADLLTLTSWNNQNVHGVVQLHATLESDAAGLRASGTASVSDLHRWDLLPTGKETPTLEAAFDAVIALPSGTVSVRALKAPLGDGMLEGTGVIEHLGQNPSAQFRVNFSGARASSALAALEHFSSRISTGSRMEGTVDGELDIRGLPLRVEGSVTAHDLDFSAPGVDRTTIKEARVDFHSSAARMEPVALNLPEQRHLTVGASWDWDTRRSRISLAGTDVRLPTLLALARASGFGALPDGLASSTDARVTLGMEAELGNGASPRFTGWAQVARARWAPGNASPVTIHTARLDFVPGQVRATRVVASWAGGTISGSARIPLRPGAIYWADLHVNEWNSALLSGALRTASPGLLARTTETQEGQARPAPGLNANGFHAEGRLSISRLLLRRLAFSDVQTAFRISDKQLDFDRTRATFGGGQWEGSGTLDLSGGSPHVLVSGRLRAFSIARLAEMTNAFAGMADGSGEASVSLASSGWESAEMARNLSGKIRFLGRDITLRNIDLQAAAAGLPEVNGITRLGACSAVFAAEKGRVLIQNMNMLTAGGTGLVADGSVDFRRRADIRVRPLDPQAGQPNAPIAFRVVGSLDSPRVSAIEQSK